MRRVEGVEGRSCFREFLFTYFLLHFRVFRDLGFLLFRLFRMG